MHKKYVIEGDLTQYIKPFDDRQRVWDAIAEFRSKVCIDLLNQHNGSLLFTGPIAIIGSFYFTFPKGIAKHKRVCDIPHTRRPTMSSLIYFVEHMASGILFGNGINIASIECNKIYTIGRARVEMEIMTMDT